MSLCCLECFKYICHVCLEHETANDELIKDKVDLIQVENEIELAHVFEASIEGLNEDLYKIKDTELRLCSVDAKHEEKSGVVAIYKSHIGTKGRTAVYEVTQSVGTAGQQRKCITDELLLPIFGCVLVKLGQSGLTMSV